MGFWHPPLHMGPGLLSLPGSKAGLVLPHWLEKGVVRTDLLQAVPLSAPLSRHISAASEIPA